MKIIIVVKANDIKYNYANNSSRHIKFFNDHLSPLLSPELSLYSCAEVENQYGENVA